MRKRLLACVVALASTGVAGQSPPTRMVQPGQEVRLSLPGKAIVQGTLVRVTEDTVYLALTRGDAPAVPRSAVLLTEVRERGGAGAGAARGAKIGGVVGLAVGIVAAFTPSRCESGGRRVSCDSVLFGGLAESLSAVAIVVTPLLGAAVGGVVGTVVPPMVWRRAALPPTEATARQEIGPARRVPMRAPAGLNVSDPCAVDRPRQLLRR